MVFNFLDKSKMTAIKQFCSKNFDIEYVTLHIGNIREHSLPVFLFQKLRYLLW